MKMNKNTKGFTLIELILVIVILGILGAVAVPRFSGLQETAKVKVEEAVINQIKAGLQSYAAEKLIDSGKWTYPASDTPAADFFDLIMDEIEDGWTYTAGADDETAGVITYNRDGTVVVTWEYAIIPKGTVPTGGGAASTREKFTITYISAV